MKTIGDHLYKKQIGMLEKLFPNKTMKEIREIIYGAKDGQSI